MSEPKPEPKTDTAEPRAVPMPPPDFKLNTLSLPAGTKITIGSGGATVTFPEFGT